MLTVTLEEAFRKLLHEVDSLDRSQDESIESIVKKDLYQLVLGQWLGCEVISLYVVPMHPSGRTDPNQHDIAFLHDHSDNFDFPMYDVTKSVGDIPGSPPFHSTPIDHTTVKRRRNEQRKIMSSADKRLTARLCVRHLAAGERSVVIPFGEILSYCFLYHIITAIMRVSAGIEINWRQVGVQAWNAIKVAYGRRKSFADSDVEEALVAAIHQWYFEQHDHPTYSKHRSPTFGIPGASELSQPLREMLSIIHAARNGDVGVSITPFLELWGRELFKSLPTSPGKQTPIETFWQNTLINPDIEEFLGTRGLYVTVIRSPLKSELHGASSQAYAICTFYDTDVIKDNIVLSFDNLLIRLSHTALAQHDFRKITRDEANQEKILGLLQKVSSQDCDWNSLFFSAATVSLKLSNARKALLCWFDVGAILMSREGGGENHEWFGYASILLGRCKQVADRLRDSSHSPSVIRIEADVARVSRLQKLLQDSTRESEGTFEVYMLPSGDLSSSPPGLLILALVDTPPSGIDTAESINRVGLALTIGMEMPFRNVIGQGLITKSAQMLFSGPQYVMSRIARVTGRRGARKHVQHFILFSAVATIWELTQVGFFLVGFCFIWSVAKIVYHTGRGMVIDIHNAIIGDTVATQDVQDAISGGTGATQVTPHDMSIIETLRSVEHIVMAFSICLAATGVVFLLRPDMAAGQPPWMRRFAELGTLERTLVRLAAMVLTIDVLSTVLQSPSDLKDAMAKDGNLWQAMQPTVFHVGMYLCILIGLSFLSRFLLPENDELGSKDHAQGLGRRDQKHGKNDRDA